MSRTRHPLHSERGQILMIAALLSTALLGMIGLIVDGGFYYSERRQVQNASDHAALAAAFTIFHGGSSAQAQATADEYALANGYEPDQVTFHHPPASGPHQGDPGFVEVIIEEQPRTFFIHVLLEGGTVAARGVAGIHEVPGEYALVVLNESQCQAYYQEGAAGLNIGGGSAMVNSDCQPNGFSKTGSGELAVDGDVHVYGGSSVTGSGSVSPVPSEVPWTVDDPLAGVALPARGAPATCPTGPDGSAANPVTCLIEGQPDRTLDPGTYYGGLDIKCVCTVTLNPGIYIMSGGGFTKSGGAQIEGDEVMIYVTTNPDNPNGDGAPRPFDITGHGSLDIDPITDQSSPYFGISLWQDAAITDDFYLSGSVGGTSGILYVPGAELDVAGVSEMNGVQIIADTFNIRGNTTLNLSYQEWVGVEVPKVFLVE